MKRSTLLVGGAAVLLAGVLLYWKLGSDDAKADSSTTANGSAGPAPRGGRAGGPGPSLPGDVGRFAPPEGATSGSDGSDDGTVRTYTVGAYTVRDHRRGKQVPMDIPPNLHPPGSRRVDPTLVRDLTTKIRDVVAECGRDIPVDARGPKPKMEGQIIIGIKNHQVSVTSSTVVLRDVVGAAVDPVKQCLTDKIATVGAPAPNEADLDGYSINLSFVM